MKLYYLRFRVKASFYTVSLILKKINFFSLILMSLFTLLLSACGQKGPLYMSGNMSEKKSEPTVQKTPAVNQAKENPPIDIDKK